MPARVLLGLILCNLVWSANPAMAKLVLADFPPSAAAWLRYASALLAYAAFYPWLRRRADERQSLASRGGRDLALAALLGFLTFCFSPIAQMAGLAASRAIENSLIVAMEPLITVLLAGVFLRERLSAAGAAAFVAALGGFTLLSGGPAEGGGWDAHRIGNLIMLLSLIGEGSYSVIGRTLLRRHGPNRIFGVALGFGVLFLNLALLVMPAGSGAGLAWMGEFKRWSWGSALGVFWLGPLATTAAYLYWMAVLEQAPVASLALTIFIQPVFGAAWGVLLLGERLSLSQSFGGLIILAAVAAPSILHRQAAKT